MERVQEIFYLETFDIKNRMKDSPDMMIGVDSVSYTHLKFKVLITGLQEDTTKNSKGQTDPSIQEIELYYR